MHILWGEYLIPMCVGYIYIYTRELFHGHGCRVPGVPPPGYQDLGILKHAAGVGHLVDTITIIRRCTMHNIPISLIVGYDHDIINQYDTH